MTPFVHRTLRVLVVEDEPRYRAFLLEVLRDMGCEPAGASDAHEARRAVATDPPDVLLLDLNLPVVDGMAFLEQFRHKHANVPVVIITGFGDLESAQRAIRLGVTEFLTKPCHLGEIEQALDRARRQLGRVDPGALRAGSASMAPHDLDEIRPLDSIEREAIVVALRACGGNRTAAARQLGISRRALYNKITEYQRQGFDVP